MVELALPAWELGGTAVGTGSTPPRVFLTGRGRGGIGADGQALCHGLNCSTPSPRRAVVFAPRGAQGPGGGSDENRQRRALAGLRPRCGLGEIQIPENEPGSSIMARSTPPVRGGDHGGGTGDGQRRGGRWPGGLPGQLRAERVHAGVHLQLPPARAAAHRLHPLL